MSKKWGEWAGDEGGVEVLLGSEDVILVLSGQQLALDPSEAKAFGESICAAADSLARPPATCPLHGSDCPNENDPDLLPEEVDP